VNGRRRDCNWPGPVDYLVGARKGQTANISLATKHTATYFNILAPGKTDEASFNGSVSQNQFEGVLPDDGTYRIRVYMMRSAARRNETADYRLEVAIGGAGGDATKAPAPSRDRVRREPVRHGGIQGLAPRRPDDRSDQPRPGALASTAAAPGTSSSNTRSRPTCVADVLGQPARALVTLARNRGPSGSPTASRRSNRVSVGAAFHAAPNRFDRSGRRRSCAASRAF